MLFSITTSSRTLVGVLVRPLGPSIGSPGLSMWGNTSPSSLSPTSLRLRTSVREIVCLFILCSGVCFSLFVCLFVCFSLFCFCFLVFVSICFCLFVYFVFWCLFSIFVCLFFNVCLFVLCSGVCSICLYIFVIVFVFHCLFLCSGVCFSLFVCFVFYCLFSIVCLFLCSGVCFIVCFYGCKGICNHIEANLRHIKFLSNYRRSGNVRR